MSRTDPEEYGKSRNLISKVRKKLSQMERRFSFGSDRSECSNCNWQLKHPALAYSDVNNYLQAKDAARSKWRDHECESYPPEDDPR